MRNDIKLKIIRFLMRRWDYFLVAANEKGEGAALMTPESEMLGLMLENVVFNRDDFRKVLEDALGKYLNRYTIDRDDFIRRIKE